ncbi:hypothetical protein M8494_36985 [Serratia ureilytica]
MSARLGIAMLVMGPLILASSIAANRKLMRRLEHSANHDFLTGVLARSAMTRKRTSCWNTSTARKRRCRYC